MISQDLPTYHTTIDFSDDGEFLLFASSCEGKSAGYACHLPTGDDTLNKRVLIDDSGVDWNAIWGNALTHAHYVMLDFGNATHRGRSHVFVVNDY